MRPDSVSFVDKLSTTATELWAWLVQVFAITQVHKRATIVDKRDAFVDNVDKSQNPLGVTCLKTSGAQRLVTPPRSLLVTRMPL